MNQSFRILTIATAFCAALALTTVTAEKTGDPPEHAHKHQGGPNGGRLLETEPHAEFFVEKDRNVTIRFFNDELKPVAVAEPAVTVLAEAKDGKVKVDFEKSGDALKSKTPLPAGDGYNLVVQVRVKPNAKPQNFRFKLDLATCNECRRPEYACICEH